MWLTKSMKLLNTMYCGDMFAPEIRMATLGNDAGIIGAAALASHC